MNTIFINSKNSKTFDSHRLLMNKIITDKIILERCDEYATLPNPSICCTWKNIKSHTIAINLKYQLQHGMKNLNCLMDRILY